jgi:hypothetical protein
VNILSEMKYQLSMHTYGAEGLKVTKFNRIYPFTSRNTLKTIRRRCLGGTFFPTTSIAAAAILYNVSEIEQIFSECI